MIFNIVDIESGVLYLATKYNIVIRKNVKTDVEGLGPLFGVLFKISILFFLKGMYMYYV